MTKLTVLAEFRHFLKFLAFFSSFCKFFSFYIDCKLQNSKIRNKANRLFRVRDQDPKRSIVRGVRGDVLLYREEAHAQLCRDSKGVGAEGDRGGRGGGRIPR